MTVVGLLPRLHAASPAEALVATGFGLVRPAHRKLAPERSYRHRPRPIGLPDLLDTTATPQASPPTAPAQLPFWSNAAAFFTKTKTRP